MKGLWYDWKIKKKAKKDNRQASSTSKRQSPGTGLVIVHSGRDLDLLSRNGDLFCVGVGLNQRIQQRTASDCNVSKALLLLNLDNIFGRQHQQLKEQLGCICASPPLLS